MFGLLGQVTVCRAGRPVRLGGARQRTVLALLLLEAGRQVTAERLIDTVWGDHPPRTARKALQVNVVHLRRALAGLDGVAVVTARPGYVIEVPPGRVDLYRFRRLVASAAAEPPQRASPLLREALGLWRGPALADLSGNRWAGRVASALEEERLAVVERRIEVDLKLGRHVAVVPELAGLVADHPLRERLHGLRMRALYRSGRGAEAGAAYRDARRTLVDELGVEPGPELRALHRAILAGDALTDAPEGRGRPGRGVPHPGPRSSRDRLPPDA